MGPAHSRIEAGERGESNNDKFYRQLVCGGVAGSAPRTSIISWATAASSSSILKMRSRQAATPEAPVRPPAIDPIGALRLRRGPGAGRPSTRRNRWTSGRTFVPLFFGGVKVTAGPCHWVRDGIHSHHLAGGRSEAPGRLRDHGRAVRRKDDDSQSPPQTKTALLRVERKPHRHYHVRFTASRILKKEGAPSADVRFLSGAAAAAARRRRLAAAVLFGVLFHAIDAPSTRTGRLTQAEPHGAVPEVASGARARAATRPRPTRHRPRTARRC